MINSCRGWMIVVGMLSAVVFMTSCNTASVLMSGRKAVGNPDQMFLMTIARESGAEAQASQLAVERATDPQIKQFAQHAVADHQRMNQELHQLAEQKGLTITTAPDELHAELAAHLRALSGREFDREFMSTMVADHAKMMSKFESKAKMAKDPQIRQWAASKVPALREHWQTAQQINQNMMMAAESPQ